MRTQFVAASIGFLSASVMLAQAGPTAEVSKAVVPAAGSAESASFDENLRALIKLTGVARKYEDELLEVAGDFEERGRTELAAAYRNAIRGQIAAGPLEDRLVLLYRQYFTEGDARALRQFFESPLGERYLRATAMMPAEIENVTRRWHDAIEEAVRVELERGPLGDRIRQRRAMGDLRSLATAVQARSTDTEDFPAVADFREVVPFLLPDYIQACPEADPWGNPYEYYFYTDAEGVQRFQFISRGADGRPDQAQGRYQGSDTTTGCYANDIVWDTDKFVVRPEGAQTDCK